VTIVNRRNAVVGWMTLQAGKAVVRRKARRVSGKLGRPAVRPSRNLTVLTATATAVTLGVVAYKILRAGE
jgi:uncharacterized membrane protein